MNKTGIAITDPTHKARTKIVATIGPACRKAEQLTELVQAGADVFRVNMAHGKRKEHEEIVATIRRVSLKMNHALAILVDLAGPKMRLGELPGEVECRHGSDFYFIRGELPGGPNELTTTYEPLVDELKIGDKIMLADGTVGMTVMDKKNDSVQCRVFQAGVILSRQGVNLPGANLSVKALSDEDIDNAIWAARAGIDYIGLSFVRQAEEVRELKAIVKKEGSQARVVAKIEKQEALDNLEAIVEAADGVMVARGDLGVETDVARMPVEQKRIIAQCNKRHKPVIVATQMLDSMRHSLQPTRAEVTDVANAILDGCDACMLSQETAVGDHPAQAVAMMNRIALRTEPLFRDRPPLSADEAPIEDLHRVTQAVVNGVHNISSQLNSKLIVVATHSGATALALSKQRGIIPIVALTDSETSLRHMCLFWNVTPLSGILTSGDSGQLLTRIEEWGKKSGYLETGDRILLVSGIGLVAAGHNMLVVHEIS